MAKKQTKKGKKKTISADELEDEEDTPPKLSENVQTSEEFDLGDLEPEQRPPHKKNLELYIKEQESESNSYDKFNKHEYSLINNVFFEPKSSGDYSKEASDSKPERKIMGKIAQLES